MSTSLSDLVDNLPGIYKKECKACMERKKKSECDFTGFKNNTLNYKCKECRRRYFKSINESIKNFRIMHQFCS